MSHLSPTPSADLSIPGMRIQPGGADDPWALVVRTAQRQEGWILEPTDAADRNSIAETPATIIYQGVAFRIHEAEETGSGWIYRMRPCPDGETQLNCIELNRASLERVAADRKEHDKIQKLAHRSANYELLFGWLPAHWQVEMSERWHFSPADASRKNGLLMFFIGIGSALPVLRFGFELTGSSSGGFLMMGIALDGAIRWANALAAERPLGMLPLEAADWVMRTVFRRCQGR